MNALKCVTLAAITVQRITGLTAESRINRSDAKQKLKLL